MSRSGGPAVDQLEAAKAARESALMDGDFEHAEIMLRQIRRIERESIEAKRLAREKAAGFRRPDYIG